MNKTTIKKNFFLCVAALLVVLLLVAINPVRDKKAEAFSYSGQNVFIIDGQESFDELIAIKNNDFTGKTIRLFCDVDLEAHQATDLTFSTFNGVFEGNGHIVYGCTKNLFGTIGGSGVVRNLILDDCAFTTSVSLASVNNGAIENVILHGTQNNVKAEGVVKTNSGSMTGVTSYLTVRTSSTTICLLCGQTNASLTDSAFLGSVVSTSTAEAYSVSYTDADPNDGVKERTTEYTYVNIYPFSAKNDTSTVFVSKCAAVFDVTLNTLPCTIRPCFQESASCSVVASVTSQRTTQPSFAYATSPVTVKTETVPDDDAGIADVTSYLFVPAQNLSDSYATVFYNTGTYGEPSYSSLTKVWDGGKNETDDLTDLSSDFSSFAGYYPVIDSMVEGAGTSVDPVLLDSADDFYRLRAFVTKEGGTLYVALSDNVDFSLRETVRGLVPMTINIAGNDRNLYNLPETFFGDGFTCTESGTITVAPDYTFELGQNPEQDAIVFTDSSTTTIVAEAIAAGTGSADDPYVIETAGQLKGFIIGGNNVAGKYAYLSKDIVLNTFRRHGYRLGLQSSTLNATLNGCDHVVYGLSDEPLVGTVAASGSITGLTVKTTEVDGESAGAAVCLTNNGSVSHVTVGGNGAYESSFVTANGGDIAFCQNSLPSQFAVSATNTGSVRYTVSTAKDCTYFDGNDDGSNCLQCVSHIGSEYRLYNGLTNNAVAYSANSSARYFVLDDSGFDTTDVFGYETGLEIQSMPVLRKYGGSYKTPSDASLGTQADITYGDVAYTTDSFLDVNDAEVIDWTCTYNAVTIDLTQAYMDDTEEIKDVGVYTLNVVFKETVDMLPGRDATSFAVTQANCPVNAQSIGFSDVSVVYTGSSLDVSATELSSDATASTMISSYGYTFSYKYYEGNTEIAASDVIDAGGYGQTFSASSRNYKTVTRNTRRTITITPATLAVTVTSNSPVSVRYGYELSFSSFSANAVFLGRDVGKTLSTEIADYSSRFATDYTTNVNAGTEGLKVWFDISNVSIDNYTLTMPEENKCPITVVRAPILQGGISFHNATAETNGSYAFTYDGTTHTVEASNIPSEYGCSYDRSTSFKDAGTYSISVTIDDPGADDNYESLTLTVDVTVCKATLTVIADDVTKFFGYSVSYADFTYSVTGLCQGDDAATVLHNLSLAVRPAFNENDVPGYGTYDVIVYDDSGNNFLTDNYILERTNGSFSIEKIPLTEIYKNNDSENVSFKDGGKVYDGADFDLSSLTITYFAQNSIDVSISYVYKKGDDVLSETLVRHAGTYTVTATVTPPSAGDYSETVYVCAYVITQKATSLSFVAADGYENNFAENVYTYTYVPGRTVNYATFAYCPYQANGLPDGATVQYVGDDGIEAGTHTVRVRYLGDEDHVGCGASATLTVNKFAADVSVTRTYGYSATYVSPEVSIVSDTKGEFTTAAFSYSYRDKVFGITSSKIADAGEYTMTISFENNNYSLTTDSFDITVTKLAVSVSMPSFTFTYGTVGDYTYEDNLGGTYDFFIKTNYVTYKDYVVAQSAYPQLTRDVTLDVEFRLYETDFSTCFPAYSGYTAQDIVQPKNFDLSFSGTIRVGVAKKKVDVVWYVLDDGRFKECDTGLYATEYTGRIMNGNVSYAISGFVRPEDEDASGVRFTIAKRNVSTAVSEIFDVGDYSCNISLTSGENYVVDSNNATLLYRVTKKTINIYVEDLEVQQYESFPEVVFSTDTSGLVGVDAENHTPLRDLSGFSISAPVSSYNPSTALVGDTYGFNVDIRFTNYESNYILGEGRDTQAILTVVSNTLPRYTLSSRTFVYDGMVKSLTVAADSSVTVTYENNDKVDVGNYRVKAHLRYPSGRTEDLTAELVIERATPTVVLEDSYVIWRANGKLTDDVIVGRAYVGNNFSVDGTFSFAEENAMREGAHSYTVTFTPTDVKNVLPVEGLKTTVKCYEIDGTLIVFSGEYSDLGNNRFQIRNRVVGELNRTYISEISDRVELYQNDNYVRNFILNAARTELLEIRFDGTTVYSLELSVEFYPQEEEKKEVKVDESFFMLSDFEINLSESVVYVGEDGGIISLAEEYRDTYSLYVNNIQVGAAGYGVSAEDKYITLEIRHKTLGTAYRKQFTVKNVTEKTSENKGGFKGLPTYVYIILAAAGVLIVVGVLLLLLKRH